MELKISDFEESLNKYPILEQGCIVDTNVIFAESYPNDNYNAWAEEVFEVLNRNLIPVYTNMNVRAEF
jgi:hypothetical protein